MDSKNTKDIDSVLGGWQPAAPRHEIRPRFSYLPTGGRDGKGSLVIVADDRQGLHGYWLKTFPVKGGETSKPNCRAIDRPMGRKRL